MRDDIFKCPVLLAEPTGDYAQLNKAEFPIQRKSAFVCPDNGIELQNTESAFFSLIDGMANKRFPDMMPSPFRSNGITGVADMSATSDIIWMQDIKPDYLSGFFVPCKTCEGLRGKECMTGLRREFILLGKSNATTDDLVPNREAWFNVFRRVCYYLKVHIVPSLDFCTNIHLNIHGKGVFFNEDSGANGRKTAHPALRLPKIPVWKLKK